MPASSPSPAVISVDWGLSSLRCRLVDRGGAIIASRQSSTGVRAVAHRDFRAALLTVIGDWVEAHSGLPVLLSGMVGSRLGWVEAPYVACPAGLDEIVGALLPLDVAGLPRSFIVPGVKLLVADRTDIKRADIMRGEECEVLGCLADPSSRASLYIAPGTHSKWIAVEQDRITSFTTMMTGELFSLLSSESSLAEMVSGAAVDDDSFLAGLQLARQAYTTGGILPLLFRIRADGVLGRRSPPQSRGLLSGMLIGSELAYALAERALHGSDPVIVGDDQLAALYRRALSQAFGRSSRRGPSGAASLGHLAIASHPGISA
jgi:2-dehydro-3-deoxygalactonokinase